jgi:hypothetical protein
MANMLPTDMNNFISVNIMKRLRPLPREFFLVWQKVSEHFSKTGTEIMYVGDDGLFCRQGPGNNNGAAVSLQTPMLNTNFSIVLLREQPTGWFVFFSTQNALRERDFMVLNTLQLCLLFL